MISNHSHMIKHSSNMKPKDLKYSINHQISLLPREITIDSIKELLDKHYNISSSTFDRDRSISLSDSWSIPSHRLDAYANILQVPSDKLKNYTVDGPTIYEKKSA